MFVDETQRSAEVSDKIKEWFSLLTYPVFYFLILMSPLIAAIVLVRFAWLKALEFEDLFL
jgi:hypothetical protein